MIEAELSAVIGALPHGRTDTRTAQRNRHRPKPISTVAWDLDLQIPTLRTGSFFTSLLERRKRVDQCALRGHRGGLLAPAPARWTTPVKALGADSGISKSEASRMCAQFDVEVAAFQDRSLAEQRFCYVLLDGAFGT